MADDFITGEEDTHDILDPQDVKRVEKEVQARREALEMDRRVYLERRQHAYVRVFKGEPMGDDLQIVLDDLRTFCRGEESTYHDNPRLHVLLTGRQEVYLRIKDHTQLSFDKLCTKYIGDN